MRQSTSPARLFLLEDNIADAVLLGEALEACGVNAAIERCSDGEQTLHRVTGSPAVQADLFVLDLNVPRVNGLDVLRAIRADDRYDAVPIMVLTSSQSVQDRAAAFNLRADAFLSKPADLDDFLYKVGGAISDLLRSRRRPRAQSCRQSHANESRALQGFAPRDARFSLRFARYSS